MTKPDESSTASPAPGAQAARRDELTALLLEVLRNVNRESQAIEREAQAIEREAQAAPALEGAALFAVLHFQQISLQLRTPADLLVTGPGPVTPANQPAA